jgi:hypothetical protein|tara:strand:+ start:343 stop:546 length:204 start_codon:yes stop_codon:yes gene_type:complete
MSVGESIHFNGNRKKGQPNVFPRTPRVNLNNLMKKVKAEEKKSKRNNLVISVVALSTVAIFGVILTQ